MRVCRAARTDSAGQSTPFPLMWSTLPDGSVDFINRRLLESTGLSIEALLGSGWQSIIHPDDRADSSPWRLVIGLRYRQRWKRVWTAQRDYRR